MRCAALILVLAVAGCTADQQRTFANFVGGVTVLKSAQCTKSVEERRRDWEATGRRITPLDCDGDGQPDDLTRG